MLLPSLICVPLGMALILCLIPRNFRFIMQIGAVAATFATMLAGLLLFLRFNSATPDADGYRFVSAIPFLGSEQLGMACKLGVDGINIGLVLMGSLVAFAAACCSWEIKTREKEFYILLLVMTGGILGAFASMDLFFFYFFHELALVPTFIMIGVWGRGENKNYATFQITLYLSLGALVALIGLIAVYLRSGANTFYIPTLTKYALGDHHQAMIFPVLLLGFGILISLWPFHSWAPQGYAAAPTPTAMLHAGVLKKFGLYGLIRIALPMMPMAAAGWAQVIGWLCLGNIIYCGLVATKQKNLNWLVGYSSVAHMGFVFLGIASLTLLGITGAVLVMIAHGLLAALTFGLTGYFYEKTGTLELAEMGGLLRRMPFAGAVLIMAMFAGCGLPGFANFAGELTVFFGAWKNGTLGLITAIALWGALVIGAVYMLGGIRKALHGNLPERHAAVQEDSWPFWKVPYLVLLVALLWFGFFPGILADKITPAAELLLRERGRWAENRPATPTAGRVNTLAKAAPTVAHADNLN